MVHSVYSDRDIFLRELVANAADACEKLRTLALQDQALLGDDPDSRITLSADHEAKTLTVVGQRRRHEPRRADRSARHHRADRERGRSWSSSATRARARSLIGQFGVGFYSAFMVAGEVDVLTRKAGESEAWLWSSDGQGTYTIEPAGGDAPVRGTRVVLHLNEGSEDFASARPSNASCASTAAQVPVAIDSS